MTEQAAKLTVKVKLHAAQPVVLPTAVAPARLSKFKVFLGVLVLLLLTAAGYLVWQQFVGKVPSAVAADHQPATDVAAIEMEDAAAEDMAISAGPGEMAGAGLTQPSNATPSAVPDESMDELLQNSAMGRQSTAAPTVAASTVVTKNTEVAPPAVTAAAAAQQTPAQAVSAGSRNLPEGFSRIVLAATMEQLEPGAAIDKLVAQQQIQRLYLFTELKGYAGQQLIHRWSFAGQIQTEALLTIEDSPWRTYSEKWLLPDQLGNWRVEIVDQQQNVLYQHDFQYQ